MTNASNQVPEPKKEPKEETDIPPPVDPPIWSSEDDSADEELDVPNTNGYQPLTLSEHEGGVSEFHLQQLDSSDDEDEVASVTGKQEETREISFNPDLVLSAMQKITIPGSSIPQWAKEMSESEWEAVVQRTIQGDCLAASAEEGSSDSAKNNGSTGEASS